MGFFDKLFGNSKKQEETQTKNKVRAQFKDEKYFKGQIERCNRFIASDEKDDIEYIKQNGKLTAFHYISSASIRLMKLENYYSVGERKQTIADLLDETIEFFIKGFDEGYQSSGKLLQIVSLSILLDISKEKFNKIINFIDIVDKIDIEERWKPDSLVFFLIGESDKLRKGFNKPNQKLFEITKLTKLEAENAINNYLKDWYSMNKDEPWYNSHLRDHGYSGYWAWEVAAVVKVMGLDDATFKNNPYYPYDMVHWKD